MKLPAPPPSTLWKDMAEFQRFAEDIQARITDPNQKKLLGDMLQQLSVARAKAQEVVPGVLDNMKKEAELHQAEVPKMAAELERLQAELEAKRAEGERLAAQAKAPVGTPEAPVDPSKGRQLTEELLKRFAPPAAPGETPFEDAGSVAREWVETESTDPSGVHPAPAARPPTMRPAPKKPADPAKKTPEEGEENDIWEGLSRMEGD
jgi:hypothetical protein